MKKWTGLLLSCTMMLCAFLILPIHAQTQIYDQVIRLHVLANSDSEEDQALKLCVRDSVLAKTEALLLAAESREQAEQILRANLPLLKETAEQTLRENGAANKVEVTLSEEDYPRRTYEHAALPAGEYLSLQVKIGDAKGQNWWCVLFPPMCLSAATAERESACLAAGLTEEQYRLITDSDGAEYRLRFKLVETLESWFG